MVCVAFAFAAPQCFFACVMTRKKGKRPNCRRRRHRRSQKATDRRRLRRGERRRRALRGLLARRPVRRVLVATAAKIIVQVDVPEALALAVLRDAALYIAHRVHRTPAQAFRPEGTPNVKPPGQHHMCSHKSWVVYQLATVYLTLSGHCLHEGRQLPYALVQGFVRPWWVWPTCLTSYVGMFCCSFRHDLDPWGAAHCRVFPACFGVRACVVSFCAKS